MATNEQTIPVPVGSEAIAELDEGESQVPVSSNTFPLAEGMSLSYWLQGVRSNPLLDHRSTGGIPAEADVVIIGSGLTGTLTAYELLKSENPPSKIVLLEARELCSGATGRNAGHCKPDQYRGFTGYQKRFGTEQALKIIANEYETWDRLVSFVREHKVDCDLWVGKTLDVCMDQEIADAAAKTFTDFKAAGGRTDHIEHITDREEAVKRTRIKGAVSAFSWDSSTLYPWKLTAFIMQLNLSLGLNFQTWTPVQSVSESTVKAGQWVVKTERGSITTPTVVHATNAYVSAILPELQSFIRPTPHMCNKVIPPHSWSGTKSLQNSYAVLNSDGSIFSINPRSTSDGIVLFGGGNPAQPKLIEYVNEKPEERRINDGLINFKPVMEAVRDFAEAEFEGWGKNPGPGQGYDYSWSGIIGNSADGVPYIGAVPDKPGQWICAGHNGHGMGRIMTAAPGLAKLVQGAKWEDTGLPECFEITKARMARLQELVDKGLAFPRLSKGSKGPPAKSSNSSCTVA